MSERVLAIPGVFFTDLDEAENRVAVGLFTAREATARAEVEKALSGIGIPRDAVIFEADDTVIAEPAEIPYVPPSGTTLRSYARPLRAGMQLGRALGNNREGVCTISWVAPYDDVVWSVGTATHCSPTWAGLDNEPYGQPFSGNHIGSETRDRAWFSCGLFGVNRCRDSDSNVIGLAPNVDAGAWTVAHPTNDQGSIEIDSQTPYFWVVAETDLSYIGDPVDKIGRTSGWTYGWVTRTCSDYAVAFFSNRELRCQDSADYTSADGDSGAPVMIVLNWNEVVMTGVHSGRYWRCCSTNIRAIFSPMRAVRNENPGISILPIY